MASWLSRVLADIARCVAAGDVRFTSKARLEMRGLGCDTDDVHEVLSGLTEEDFFARLRSERTGEWMYVFKPWLVGNVIYLKLVIRAGCVIISFHEDSHDDE